MLVLGPLPPAAKVAILLAGGVTIDTVAVARAWPGSPTDPIASKRRRPRLLS